MTEDAALPGASAPPRRRPPGVIPWPEIRAAYEGSDTPLQLIAAAYGIGVTDIYPRAEREGWTLRRDRRALERKAVFQRAPVGPGAAALQVISQAS